jgi:hypothetical protein
MNPLAIEDQLTGYVDQHGREYAVHIKFLRTILWLSIATTPLVRGTDVGLQVWAVNDSVRIDPVRNQPFEDNQKLFPDGIHRGYKDSNLIWNGASRRITLQAARNETVAFQIVIERTGKKLSNVVVKPAELKGPMAPTFRFKM